MKISFCVLVPRCTAVRIGFFFFFFSFRDVNTLADMKYIFLINFLYGFVFAN